MNTSSTSSSQNVRTPLARYDEPTPSYPPESSGSGAQYPLYSSESLSSAMPDTDKEGVRADTRAVTRTPSPTPSEAAALSGKGATHWGLIAMVKRMDRAYFKNTRNLISLGVTLLVIGLLVLFLVFENDIVDAVEPAASWLRSTPGAWIIPIVIMIVMSFPPLFGQEVVAVLCGICWGIGEGFAIVAAGTVIGEIIIFFVFKHFCMARGQKIEAKNLKFALTAEVIRRGGLLVAAIIRYSAIPGHVTTAFFSTAGLSFWMFLGALVLALPQQLAVVYIGVSNNTTNASPSEAKTLKIVKIIVIAVTVFFTSFSMHFINARIDAVTSEVIYGRRKARQAKLASTPSALPLSAPTADGEVGADRSFMTV